MLNNKQIKKMTLKQGILFVSFFLTISFAVAQQRQSRIVKPFDAGWSFKKENLPTGPEKVTFDASNWRKVDVPHDWSIEDLPNQIADSIIGPFSKGAIGTINTGYTIGETAWYRKSFTLSPKEIGKTVYIHFDGVYMNSDVWVNGHHLGNHVYGYTPFYYNLTPFLFAPGKENIIAVRVKNEGVNSRWYSGSGIYRHVWLSMVNPVHVDVWGTYITTPKVSKSSANVQVITTIINQTKSNQSITLQTQILDIAGNIVATVRNQATVFAGNKSDVKQIAQINNPQLWNLQTPVLYKAKTAVLLDGKESDGLTTTFGIRDIQIDAQHGLLINGERVIVRGGCVHHDYGPLGAAAIDRAEERKIELLKSNGFNAIRCSHNAPSQNFLDICDRLGMLVLDEAFDMWLKEKNPNDYHLYFNESWNADLTSMIQRDRNHPSIFLWSVGNEIPERIDSIGLEIRKKLVNRVHELEPSRMVTEAICRTPQWEKKTPLAFKTLDVAGYNYKMDKYESDHEKFPQRIIIGTETYPDKVLENYTLAEKHPYVLGDFVWTAMDYIGETGCGVNMLDSIKIYRHNVGWPWFNAYTGNIDLIGNKKTPSYYRDVVWRSKPVVMAVHSPMPAGMVENISGFGWPDEMLSWTWAGAEGKELQVRVFSRAPMVRLLLNGKVIGERRIPQDSITAVFSVPYQPGSLKVVNVIDGKETDAFELKTTGTPFAIRLKADRTKINADRNDLSYVNVEIIDANGNVVPNVDDIEVNYSISGNGEIAGVGNGNPTDLSSFQQPKKKVFHGKGLAIVRPKGAAGKIVVKANAKGLKEGVIEIITE
jgi:beta-galactosidase